MHTKDTSPNSRPSQKPTRASFQTIFRRSLPVNSSSISTRMVTARDWVPELPDIPKTTDWKKTMRVSCFMTRSNIPATVDTPSPRQSKMSSQGRRFFIL